MKDLKFKVYKIDKNWHVKDLLEEVVIEEGKTKKEVIAKVIHNLKGNTNSEITFIDSEDKVVYSRLFVDTKYRKAAHKMRKNPIIQN
jgi:NCAIR mutase (PurE)-related protein